MNCKVKGRLCYPEVRSRRVSRGRPLNNVDHVSQRGTREVCAFRVTPQLQLTLFTKILILHTWPAAALQPLSIDMTHGPLRHYTLSSWNILSHCVGGWVSRCEWQCVHALYLCVALLIERARRRRARGVAPLTTACPLGNRGIVAHTSHCLGVSPADKLS